MANRAVWHVCGTSMRSLGGSYVDYVLTQPQLRCKTTPALIDNPSDVAPGTTTSYVVWYVAQNVITPAKPAGDWQNAGVNLRVEPEFFVGPTNGGNNESSGPHVCKPNSYTSYMWLVEKPAVCG
jgi:hypothetical protein